MKKQPSDSTLKNRSKKMLLSYNLKVCIEEKSYILQKNTVLLILHVIFHLDNKGDFFVSFSLIVFFLLLNNVMKMDELLKLPWDVVDSSKCHDKSERKK